MIFYFFIYFSCIYLLEGAGGWGSLDSFLLFLLLESVLFPPKTALNLIITDLKLPSSKLVQSWLRIDISLKSLKIQVPSPKNEGICHDTCIRNGFFIKFYVQNVQINPQTMEIWMKKLNVCERISD